MKDRPFNLTLKDFPKSKHSPKDIQKILEFVADKIWKENRKEIEEAIRKHNERWRNLTLYGTHIEKKELE